MMFTLDIINLLNRRNVDLSAVGADGRAFNNYTGAPYVYGDFDAGNRLLAYSWAGALGSPSFDARIPPFVFDSPRQVTFGVRVTWE